MKFSTDVEVTQSFTDSASALQAAVNTTELEQEYTSLYDGLHQGLSDLAAETTSFRFAVLFTDGVDNDSEHTSTEVETLFEDNDIPVCVIGVGFADVGELRDIAEDSGCFFIYKTLFTDLTDAFGMVVDQVESVYRVRFNTADLQGFSTLRLTITTSDGARTVTRDL